MEATEGAGEDDRIEISREVLELVVSAVNESRDIRVEAVDSVSLSSSSKAEYEGLLEDMLQMEDMRKGTAPLFRFEGLGGKGRIRKIEMCSADIVACLRCSPLP